MQTVAIIDYGSGNLHSAAKAFERAAREAGTQTRILVTSSAAAVAKADRIVLPGVGAFADCKAGLMAVPGMREALEDAIITRARPFLGICVGMQLLATRGLEFTTTAGLGWIPGEVRAITPSDPALKIPHMGWNTLNERNERNTTNTTNATNAPQPNAPTPHPLLTGIATGDNGLHAYFVHSYQLYATDPAMVVATTDYGGTITALVARGNIAGTQFHPEKSQTLGLKLISNFLSWQP
ncbi:MAG: imidazole glycerol phosphate synthase subunit HisH [Hyphomicrobiaceae bacterium]